MAASSRQLSAPLLFGVVWFLCGLTTIVLQFLLAETLPRFGGRVGSMVWRAEYLLLPIVAGFTAFFALARRYYRFEERTRSTAMDHLRHCLVLYAAGGFLLADLLSCQGRGPGENPCHPDAIIVELDLVLAAFGGVIADSIAAVTLRRRVSAVFGPRS
jgi:hypothetical protein